MNHFQLIMQVIGTLVDCLGVFVIILGIIISLKNFISSSIPHCPNENYNHFRQNIGRSILLGLEFLVAGDIIRTVVVAPTLENVIVLGVIVLIRTFLSTAIQFELEGKSPWAKKESV
jgi:uncharacterized membrane protein